MEQAEDDVIDVLSLIPPEILMNDNEDIDETLKTGYIKMEMRK